VLNLVSTVYMAGKLSRYLVCHGDCLEVKREYYQNCCVLALSDIFIKFVCGC